MKRKLTPSQQQPSSHYSNTMTSRLSNSQLHHIRINKDLAKQNQYYYLEKLKTWREKYQRHILIIKFYYDEFKPNMKTDDNFAGLTDEDLEEKCKKIEFSLQDKKEDFKLIVKYYEDVTRYFVSLRQQNLNNVLKYHKLIKEFEDLKIEQCCNGDILEIPIEGTDEKITGESEIARLGSNKIADDYLERKENIEVLIRCGFYFK